MAGNLYFTGQGLTGFALCFWDDVLQSQAPSVSHRFIDEGVERTSGRKTRIIKRFVDLFDLLQ